MTTTKLSVVSRLATTFVSAAASYCAYLLISAKKATTYRASGIASKAASTTSAWSKFVAATAIAMIFGISLDAGINNAHAVTLVDTGAGSTSPWTLFGARALGGKFSLSSPYAITEVQAYLAIYNGPTSLSLEIWSDSSNSPSVSLYSETYSTATHTSYSWQVFSGLTNWVLGAGDYWVVLIVNSCSFPGSTFCGNWYGNSSNPLSSYAGSQDSGGSWSPLYSPSGDLAVRVYGDAAELTATPLPTALPLFASGLGALGFIGWRRKRKKARATA